MSRTFYLRPGSLNELVQDKFWLDLEFVGSFKGFFRDKNFLLRYNMLDLCPGQSKSRAQGKFKFVL